MKLPTVFTTITPFSKFLSFVLFILLPLLTFKLGIEYQQSVDQTQNTSNALSVTAGMCAVHPLALLESNLAGFEADYFQNIELR